MALSQTVAPAAEPVTVAEVKAHCRVFHDDDNDYLEDFVIPAARQYAETFTRRAFISQTWVLRLTGFGCGPIVLPRPPLASISSVAYVDSNGTSQTWSEGADGYKLERPTGERALHGSIQPAYSETYPSTRGEVDDVTITYVAGYGASGSSVPAGIKHAILVLCEDLYRTRGSSVAGPASPAVLTAERLLGPFVAHRFDLRFD